MTDNMFFFLIVFSGFCLIVGVASGIADAVSFIAERRKSRAEAEARERRVYADKLIRNANDAYESIK